MRLWIITVGEPLPTDPGQQRLWRSGLIARLMAGRDHDVTWWTSTMDHFNKVQNYEPGETRELGPKQRLIYLHGMIYRRNVSVQRIMNHIQTAAHFRRLAPGQPPPDLILCSLPTLELSREAVKYGRRHGVPVVIDLRDQWPDFIEEQSPRWLRPLMKLLLLPMRNDLKVACRGAAAFISNAPAFIKWGADAGGREPGHLDRFIPHGYPESTVGAQKLEQAGRVWDEQGVTADGDIPNICFLGNIRRTVFDFESVIEAGRILAGKVRFVICGRGDDLPALEEMAKGLTSVVFPGWVDEPALRSLTARSIAGLAPYLEAASFLEALPNKPVEYMSAGLPLISSLEGFTRDLLSEHQCGYFFKAGDTTSLVSAVEELMNDPAERKQRSENAHNLFLDRFSADKVYGDLGNYLEGIAAEGEAI